MACEVKQVTYMLSELLLLSSKITQQQPHVYTASALLSEVALNMNLHFDMILTVHGYKASLTVLLQRDASTIIPNVLMELNS